MTGEQRKIHEDYLSNKLPTVLFFIYLTSFQRVVFFWFLWSNDNVPERKDDLSVLHRRLCWPHNWLDVMFAGARSIRLTNLASATGDSGHFDMAPAAHTTSVDTRSLWQLRKAGCLPEKPTTGHRLTDTLGSALWMVCVCVKVYLLACKTHIILLSPSHPYKLSHPSPYQENSTKKLWRCQIEWPW